MINIIDGIELWLYKFLNQDTEGIKINMVILKIAFTLEKLAHNAEYWVTKLCDNVLRNGIYFFIVLKFESGNAKTKDPRTREMPNSPGCTSHRKESLVGSYNIGNRQDYFPESRCCICKLSANYERSRTTGRSIIINLSLSESKFFGIFLIFWQELDFIRHPHPEF